MSNFERKKQMWAWLRSLNLTYREEQYLLHQTYQEIEQLFDAIQQKSIDISSLNYLSKKTIENNRTYQAVERANEILCKHCIEIILREEHDFPFRMHHVLPAPEMLYYKGNRSLLSSQKCLGVVGSRHVNDYGIRMTRKLVYEVGLQGIHSVSGLAEGIDATAHHASLQAHPNASTIAVMFTGLNSAYPNKNQKLFDEIVEKGLVISERAPYHKIKRYEIPLRNRLMAAMSDVMLLPQATKKSGTQYTIAAALDLGIEVAAIPGPIDDELSDLPNYLLQLGAAAILKSQDILDMFGIMDIMIAKEEKTHRIKNKTEKAVVNQAKEQQTIINKKMVSENEWCILNLLQNQSQSIDSLIMKTGFTMPILLICLTKLEQKNMIHKDNVCNQFQIDVALI